MSHGSPLSPADRENFVAYLDGELDEATSGALEAKLTQSSEARAELEALRRTWRMLDHLPRPEPSREFTSQTLSRLTIPGPRRPRAGWRPLVLGLAWAAALLLAGMGGFAGARWLHRPAALPPLTPAEFREALAHDASVLENRRLYESVGSVEFLKKLADPMDPDLFAEDDLGA